MDDLDFLRGMAASCQTTPAPEQEAFVRSLAGSIGNNQPVLIEADGGIGKTLGYLVIGMREAHRRGRPLIVATSTITNRDQIRTEHKKIVEYARSIGDPIGDIPLFNARSLRDYASPDRLEARIDGLEQTDAPKRVLADLYEIRARLGKGDALLENIMPHDISLGEDDGKIFVERRQIAARKIGEIPESLLAERKQISDHAERACVVVMTQAMLAKSRRLQMAVRDGEIAMVVIDETDKLTSMDFVTFTSLILSAPDNRRGNIQEILERSDAAGIDTAAVRATVGRLEELVADIKASAPSNHTNVILIHQTIGERRTKAVYAIIRELALGLDQLAEQMTEVPIANWSDEISYSRLVFALEEMADAATQLAQYMYPERHREWSVNVTDLEVFLSWEEGDEFRVAAARPGALVEFLFRPGVTVPVLLTTAFLGESDRSFATKVALSIQRVTRLPAIRARRFGELRFVYFKGLADAIHVDPHTGIKTPNPAHFDDIERILRSSPWSWEPGNPERKRVLVLTPGYEDIKEIHDRLKRHGSNAPIFAHLRGTNINEIRDRLVQSNEGGILLTVYWEGFNIVGEGPKRRGLVDVMVMSRIPFQRPNRMLESLHKHLNWNEHLVRRGVMIEAKRRIHQGINRVIRGLNDMGTVLVCDSRFPAPEVLVDLTDAITPQRRYADLRDAIPDRFRSDERCFDLRDFNTMESLL
jgi:Rad3-related DNA helicase